MATLEIHTDHHESPLQAQSQQCDCCLQCCPGHNLAPIKGTQISNVIQRVIQPVATPTSQVHEQTILQSIFRPPMA